MKMKLQSTTVQSTAMLFLLAMMTSLLAAEPVKTKGKATQQKVAKEQIVKKKTTKGQSTTKKKSTTKEKGVKVKAVNKIVLPANFESIKVYDCLPNSAVKWTPSPKNIRRGCPLRHRFVEKHRPMRNFVKSFVRPCERF